MMHATSNKNLKEFGEEGEEYTTHAFEGMQIQELQELQWSTGHQLLEQVIQENKLCIQDVEIWSLQNWRSSAI